MKKTWLILFLSSSAVAAPPPPTASRSCVACHGEQGISSNDLWPNLQRQKEKYLEKQLLAFRSGQRYDPLMSPVSKDLSDQEIRDLAAYYSKMGASP